MQEKNSFSWTFARTMSGPAATFRERSIWEEASSNATSSAKSPIPVENSFFIAVEASVLRWPPKTFRRWDTRMWNPWTAAGKAGYRLDCPRPRANCLIRCAFSLRRIGWGGRIRTSTILINSEVSYRLDHAPAAETLEVGGLGRRKTRARLSLRYHERAESCETSS